MINALSVHCAVRLDGLNLLAGIPVPPIHRKDRDVNLRISMAKVLSCVFRSCRCMLNDPTHNSEALCKRHDDLVRFLNKGSGVGLGVGFSPSALSAAHLVLARDTPNPGDFRVGKIGVDVNQRMTGFVAGQLDIKKALDAVSLQLRSSSRPRHEKALFCVYVLSFLHPFEDGNGRVIRGIMPGLASGVGKEGFLFWLYFSAYCKFEVRALSEALGFFASGDGGGLRTYYDAAISGYSRFLRVLEDGELSSSLNGGSIKEVVRDSIETRSLMAKG